MSFVFYAAGFGTIFISSLVQGLTGFGFALIAVPLLSLFILPKEIVPMVVLYSFFTNIAMLSRLWKNVRLKEMLLLVISGIIGIPLGIAVLNILPANGIKLFAGLIIVITSVFMISGFTLKIKNLVLSSITAGFTSGFLNGSTSMSGPPIVLFYANRDVEKDVFRANLPAYSFITNAITVLFFSLNHMISKSIIQNIFFFFPAFLIGVISGMFLVRFIHDEHFKKMVLILIFFIGVYTVVTSIKIF